jgi:hypothetical protein
MRIWTLISLVAALGLVTLSGLRAQECPNTEGWSPTQQEVRKILSEKTRVKRPSLCKADLTNRNLNNENLDSADLNEAVLKGASLIKSSLRETTLFGAQLSNAKLLQADLTNAELQRANLVAADIRQADLTGASLEGADLSNARLNAAILKEANLINAIVTDAILAHVDLTNAVYAPTSEPPVSSVVGIRGLSTVIFPDGMEAGLVQLREVLRKTGLRDLEREATYSIERGKTSHAVKDWKKRPGRAFEGFVRFLAFDLTTAYGLHPGQAFIIILTIWLVLIPVYAIAIMRGESSGEKLTGIYRKWPESAVVWRDGKPDISGSASVERIHHRNFYAFGWSAYFSLLSAFRIGFRDLTLGLWMTRIQPNNYMLEATGWVRCISGLQSLASVYLFAMWLLTYFGRPFQ